VSDRIVFEDVSKFYGEILGVNRVNLSIPPGITSLVGPNGSGKTTLMNLMTGLVRPSRGQIRVLGFKTDDPENMFKVVEDINFCIPTSASREKVPRMLTSLHGRRLNA
jgi:ABC-2 type transport system ATP-binding protein